MTNQERNTILAALRYYADAGQGDPNNRSALIHEIATGGDGEYEDVSLDADGIEQLIARIAALDTVDHATRVFPDA